MGGPGNRNQFPGNMFPFPNLTNPGNGNQFPRNTFPFPNIMCPKQTLETETSFQETRFRFQT
jgi:hypothetical protein